MTRFTLHRSRQPTAILLALTYLGIIMALSVGFSVIFYNTSAGSLGTSNIQIQGPTNNKSTGAPSGAISLQGEKPTVITSDNVNELNTQLEHNLSTIKHNLASRLIMLNMGALLLGGLFSYFLARFTLRPMEEALDMQARFSSDASHELRTPLTALKIRGEVALRKSKLTLHEAKTVIQSSVDQAAKLEKLSEGLLRLDTSDPKALARSLSLVELTTEAMNRVIEPAQAKGITVDDAGVRECTVLADEDSMTQVITILLDNAIKYSERGSTIYIEAGLELKHGYVRVSDEGSGIHATDLPHVFERFYRADDARTKHGEHGYGLGLSIAKKLVEQNNGTIAADSTLGEGSIFTVELPLSRL